MVGALIQSDPVLRILANLVVCLYGLAIGSFLNVCIWRMPLEKSLWRSGSACPKCGTPVRWFDNVPVFAWLLWLRGRCRDCGAPISPRYPLIEILTGFTALAVWLHFGWSHLTVVYFLFAAALIVATFIDLDHMIIPNEISVGGIPVGVGLAAMGWLPITWKSAVIGAVVGAGVPVAIAMLYQWIRKQEGLGMGDIKLLGTIGAFLGWPGAVFSLMAGSLIGVSVAALAYLLGKAGWRSRMPFGPFLSAGAILYLLEGEPLLRFLLGPGSRILIP